MTASVIAMSVQAGSGGFNIAHHVAEQLGLRYYDWEITSEAADRAGVSPDEVIATERVPGFFERMMRRLGAVSAVSFEGGASFTDPSQATWNTAFASLGSDDYRPIIEHIITELAGQGHALIVGHAGQYVLRNRADTLKVLILGSEEARAKRLIQEQRIDEKDALGRIRSSDRDRAALLKKLYKFDWLDATKYDLTINTDHVSSEAAIEAIITGAKNLGQS